MKLELDKSVDIQEGTAISKQSKIEHPQARLQFILIKKFYKHIGNKQSTRNVNK